MSSNRNIIDINQSRRASEPQRSITLPQLAVSAQRTAKHHLHQLLPDFFSRIDDSLFELADKAENNQQQTLYFDAMREARLQKDVMQKAYFEALSAGFLNALVQDFPQQKSDSTLDNISLMGDDDLEESLAITNMVSSAEMRTKEALYGLTARLNYLIEDIEVTKDNNPLQPKVLFEAFIPAVQKMDAEIKVRLIIYKLFDKFVAQKIGAIYDEINADLVAAGVLPRIKSAIQRSENDPAGQHTTPAEQTATTAANDVTAPFADTSQHGNMFDSLQQLLSMTRAAPAASATNGTAGGIVGGSELNAGSSNTGTENTVHTYAPQEVLTALSHLQINSDSVFQSSAAQQDQSSAQLVKASVLEAMNQAFNDDSNKQIAQSDTDAIDIVSMLFDFILDDPSLPDNFKAQIARLQIPLLKVAILDKDFFTKKSHPARQLLNELAYAGSGLQELSSEEDTVYQMVCYVVNSILAEFEENTEIFITLHAEFAEFIGNERETNKLAGEMLENAKDRVAKEIQRRVTDNRVPPLVSTILIDAWKDVLTRLYLRDGDDSAGWNTALQVADDLIWSVQPKLVSSERQRLIKVIPRVLNGLRDGLTLIQFDRDATAQLFSGLETLHLDSLRGGKAAENTQIPQAVAVNLSHDDFGVDMSAMPEANETNQTDEDDIIEQIIFASTQPLPWEDSALNASQYAEEIKDMALGTWVEFIDAKTERRSRGKLAWKCDFTGEYTFVDRKYTVVADLSNRKLIGEFEVGRASFVDDVPLFDRALDSVISGIKHALDRKGSEAEPVPH